LPTVTDFDVISALLRYELSRECLKEFYLFLLAKLPPRLGDKAGNLLPEPTKAGINRTL
jgi:hypothetical protein